MDTGQSHSNHLLHLNGWRVILLVLCAFLTSMCALIPGEPSMPDVSSPLVTEASPAAAVQPEQTSSPAANITLSPDPTARAGTEAAATWVASSSLQPSYYFSEEDCGCAVFPAQAEARYGPGYLECNYRWSGKYIDDNHAVFTVKHYSDPADLANDFAEGVGWRYDAADSDRKFIDSGSTPDDELSISRNDPNGFNYVTTGPGGGSSKTEGEIPMCGNGGGAILVGDDYLVEVRLFACDLGEDRQVYQSAIETLEACALENIAKAKVAIP